MNPIEDKIFNEEKDLSEKDKKIILNQIENNFFKININNKENIYGFFCILKNPDNSNILPLLIINNELFIKKEDINGKTIEINNKCNNYKIIIDNSRKLFINKDIIIIEIKNYDGLNINSFLEIDDNLNKDELNIKYKNNIVYSIYFSKYEKIKCSFGKIYKINDNYEIEYSCLFESDKIFGPLINKNNFKIIGINKGLKKNKINNNIGIFIHKEINDFIKENKIYKLNLNDKLKKNKKRKK